MPRPKINVKTLYKGTPCKIEVVKKLDDPDRDVTIGKETIYIGNAPVSVRAETTKYYRATGDEVVERWRIRIQNQLRDLGGEIVGINEFKSKLRIEILSN